MEKTDREPIDRHVSNRQILVPCKVFCDRSLSFSESLIEFLWTGHRLSPSEIGKLLSMDRRNVWTLMERIAKKKGTEPPKSGPSEGILLPISLFSGREASVLELIVGYLREVEGLSNKDVSLQLCRSEKTVWTAYDRYRKRGDAQ